MLMDSSVNFSRHRLKTYIRQARVGHKMKRISSMPVHSPLYPLEWVSPGMRQLSVYCEAEEKAVRELLEPTPFSYVSNVFEVNIADFTKHSLGSFYESAVHIPVRFKELVGPYIAYMYIDRRSDVMDRAICAAREMFGYPKKGAVVKYFERGDKVGGYTERDDIRIMDISCSLNEKTKIKVPRSLSAPLNLLYKVIPSPEKNGKPVRQVVLRPCSTSSPASVASQRFGEAKVTFRRSDKDPVYRLGPKRVIGAVFTVGDFNGEYGKILATIRP